MDKHKIINKNPFPVGFRFFDNREVIVQPNSFTLLTETDIHYVNSISKLFKEGTIHCENEEMNISMGYIEKNANIISEDEIKNIFKLSIPKMKESLSKITAKHAVDKVIEIVKKADLPQSRLAVIEDVFGKKVYDDIGSEIS